MRIYMYIHYTICLQAILIYNILTYVYCIVYCVQYTVYTYPYMQVISVNTILTYICIYSYIREGWCYNHSCVVGALWYFKWIQKFRFYAKSHCKIFLAELNFFLKLNVTRISAKCHNKKCKNVIKKNIF